MTEAVIFDMDGVIIDSEQEHYIANQKLFAELDIDLRALEYDRFVGLSSQLMWQEIKHKFQLKNSLDELMSAGSKAIIDHFSQIELSPIPGIIQILDYVNERSMLLAIASSSPLEMIRLVVQKLDIAEYFDLLLSGDNVKQGKPFPDIYNRSAALLRVVPQNCVVIEDSNNGAKAAKSANMRCIGFQNPTSGNQDLSICDLVVNSFLDQNFDNIQNFLW